MNSKHLVPANMRHTHTRLWPRERTHFFSAPFCLSLSYTLAFFSLLILVFLTLLEMWMPLQSFQLSSTCHFLSPVPVTRFSAPAFTFCSILNHSVPLSSPPFSADCILPPSVLLLLLLHSSHL